MVSIVFSRTQSAFAGFLSIFQFTAGASSLFGRCPRTGVVSGGFRQYFNSSAGQ
ncbi:MAG: hypothetical protein Q8N36_01850 [bacterium]|nr:hypothetical protein [bacterium]